MQRNNLVTSNAGEAFLWRVERKFVPGFLGESLLYMFRPEDDSPRFTFLVLVPSTLIPRLGSDFDSVARAVWPFAEDLLQKGFREDLQLELKADEAPELKLSHGLRKFPLPGADGGEVGSWG